MKIKFGVIGLGHRGYEFLTESLLSNNSIEVVMVADSKETNFNQLENKNIKTTSNYLDILHDPLIEAVFIATPDDTHGEISLEAIRCNKHIILEKPLEITIEKVEKIEKALKNYKKIFMVGYVLRYAPLFAKAKEIVSSGAIGDVFLLNGTDHIDYGSYAFFRDWHRIKEKSGSLLLQKASHSLDIINWLVDSTPVQVAGLGGLEAFGTPGAIKKFGRPLQKPRACHTCPIEEECEESLMNLKKYRQIDWNANWPDQCVFDNEINVQDHQALLILYENRAKVTYTLCQFSSYYQREYQLFGTKGEMSFDDRNNQIIVTNRQDGEKTIYKFDELSSHGGGDGEMISDFIRCFKGQSEVRSGVESSASVTRLVIAAQKSIDHNKIWKI